MMSVTLVIIIITVAASFYAWSRPDIYDKWMMNPYRIRHNKEYYRFITSGFIHANYIHLGFNMLAFYFFATYVEINIAKKFAAPGYGMATFLLIYLLAIIVSDIPTFLRQQNNPGYRSLGASGGVAAIIFSSILLNPLNTIYIYFIPIKGFIFGALYLIYSYYQSKNSSDNIGHEAHFYGALFGIFFTIVLFREVLSSFFEDISTWVLVLAS